MKDGRAFAEAAKRVSKKKPVVVLKAGRTSAGAKAAASHTGALAGNDKIYEDVFKQSGVIRARSLRQLLEFARGIPVLPTPKGENVVIITGAGGSGVLLSDAVVDNGLSLMSFPPDLDEAFKKFIPPFGASGNPVDITGGEPPKTYQNTVRLGIEDDRIHALILGYWHTIVTPPMVFAKLMVEVYEEMKAKGKNKPVVASLAGDVEVEEAADYLYQHGIPAYAYSTELPVEVLGAKYKWARGAGLLKRLREADARRGEGDPIGLSAIAVLHLSALHDRPRATAYDWPLTPWTNYEHSSSPWRQTERRRSAGPQRSPRLRTPPDARVSEGPSSRPSRAGRGAGASRRPPAAARPFDRAPASPAGPLRVPARTPSRGARRRDAPGDGRGV